MNQYHFKKLQLTRESHYQVWSELIKTQQLQLTETLDYTVGVYEGDRLIATGSVTKNVIKMVVVIPDYQGTQLFNKLMSHLITYLTERHVFHYFVFTKPERSYAFENIGFKAIVTTSDVCLLEQGNYSIDEYLGQLPTSPVNQKIGAIVMEANPFTKGHLYLIQEARKNCDFLYVFVVEADVSYFSFKERFELVKAGTALMDQVKVVGGSDYMVNFATFPAYFIPENRAITEYQTRLDASLFKERIAPVLGITSRYVGEEPFSKQTAIYNESLKAVLEPEIKLAVIPRIKTVDGEIISATTVRNLIKERNWQRLQTMLPITTANYLEKKFS